MEEIRFNLAAPDLLCICVDDRQHGESSGRVYCCYSREAMHFAHEYQLIKIIERLLDRIDYPQSSVKIRSFQEKEEKRLLKPAKSPGGPRGGEPQRKTRYVSCTY